MWEQKCQNNGAEQSYRDSQGPLLKRYILNSLYFCVTKVHILQSVLLKVFMTMLRQFIPSKSDEKKLLSKTEHYAAMISNTSCPC